MSNRLVANDTFPSRLTYSDKETGQPIDITGYAFVLKIAYKTGPLVKAAVVLDQSTNLGQLEFRWSVNDLKAAASVPAEMLITHPDGTELTYKMEAFCIKPRIA